MKLKPDFDRFAEALTVLAEAKERKLSAAVIRGYFAALEDLPLEVVLEGMARCLRFGTFMPQPVEIREAVQGTPADRALEAWGRVQRAVGAGVGGWAPITFEDPVIHAAIVACGGWWLFAGLRDTDGPELHTTRTLFRDFHLLYQRRGAPADTPTVLAPAALSAGWERRPVTKLGPNGEPATKALKAAPPPAPKPPSPAEEAQVKKTVRGLIERLARKIPRPRLTDADVAALRAADRADPDLQRRKAEALERAGLRALQGGGRADG